MIYDLFQRFLTFVTRMFLNCNSQKPQPAQLVVKASGSCSPKLLSNPRLRTSDLFNIEFCWIRPRAHLVSSCISQWPHQMPLGAYETTRYLSPHTPLLHMPFWSTFLMKAHNVHHIPVEALTWSFHGNNSMFVKQCEKIFQLWVHSLKPWYHALASWSVWLPACRPMWWIEDWQCDG